MIGLNITLNQLLVFVVVVVIVIVVVIAIKRVENRSLNESNLKS